MSKFALVTHASILPAELRQGLPNSWVGPRMCPIPANFFQTFVWLEDRATCETDESMVQLLPYMVVASDDNVLSYARGAGGGEGRLHGKLSIGVGGHVDIAPEKGQMLRDLLIDEARREYSEELGSEAPATIDFTHLLYDPCTPVGRVHLGLLAVVVPPTREVRPEEGVLTDCQWGPSSALCRADVFDRLEPWSKLALLHLRRCTSPIS